MSVVAVVGLNHRTVPLEVLERMTVSPTRLPKALADLHGRDHLSEVVILSTCMRTEVYVVAERFHGAVQDVRNFLCELSNTEPDAFADHLYSFYDDAAVGQLFKVASGLDSAVLGESEVLGQVRTAWERAAAEGVCGSALAALFRHAVQVGKRARSETRIGRGTTSVSQAAVAMAGGHLGALDGKSILVIGAGDMGQGMVLALSSAGAGDVVVANRTRAKAVELARKVGGRAADFGSLAGALTDADVLLTSTGSSTPIVDADELGPVMEARAGRPLLIVDIAVPRDVDPSVRSMSGVTLLDMDDLRAFAEIGIAERRREIPNVERIIDEEVDRYNALTTARELAPLVVSLRERAETVRRGELNRHAARLAALAPDEREAVETLTRAIVAKLLHEPTVRLKGAAGTSRGDRWAEALRSLFDL